MDYISTIKQPISRELDEFIRLFNESLTHSNGLLQQVLNHILQRGGKRMRPMLVLLIARNYGKICDSTFFAGIGLELLHTASLVHDDVVDEALTRRGQASVNAQYRNKVAVLAGDFILATALTKVNQTRNVDIISYLSNLGRVLAEGEILQLSNIENEKITEEVYYNVIKQKTAALFEACCAMGAMSVNASEEDIVKVRKFGQNLGIIFQIRDDIFDYYDSTEIGKPTGNDMLEGKLTLPVIHVLLTTQNEKMLEIAYKVKARTVTQEEISALVEFTKHNGGIEYAEKCMQEYHEKCVEFINENVVDPQLKESLLAYTDYVTARNI